MKLATLCYIQGDNKTLLLHRIKKKNDVHKGLWIGLGGKLEDGESPEDCVKREVKEESGLIIKKPKLRGIMTFPKFKDNEDWHVFLYTANEFYGEIIESDEGVLKWVENNKVLDMPTWEGDLIFLKWLLEDRGMFSAKFIYENKKLMAHEVTFH
ncbi:MAG: 8-oxo-dGTP diphosphatase [Anaeromicrobium sp.]|nr:8-oxo-dGTP diphosphatase [Anaeromicrobium sp.]MCT4595194.1 8-oxo-dGTP diphosphatase [Anaeromicrobium sp.]